MRAKRIVGLCGILLVVVSTIVSAGGTAENAASSKAMTITWLGKIATAEDTTWTVQQLNERFGVKIVFNGVDVFNREQLGVMLAAGEFPDAGSATDPIDRLYKDKVIQAISVSTIRKYAPNYAKRLDTDFPVGWLCIVSPDNKDERLGLLQIREHANTTLNYPAFRSDWAQRVGFDLADYAKKRVGIDHVGRVFFFEHDYTLDQVESLLVGFRDKDPDGNGKNDTIPFSASNNLRWSWGSVMGAFGVTGYNAIVDGKLLEWNITPGYKDFLKLAARWYGMGLVDKEFPTLTNSKSWEKVQARIVGYVDFGINAAGEDWAMQRPPNNMASDAEVAIGVSVVTIPPPIGPKGLRGGWIYDPFPISAGQQLVVSRKVDATKLAMILRIADYLRWGDVEQFIWDWSGKPGVHSQWTGEPWKSRATKLPYDRVPAGYPKQGNFPNEYPNFIPRDRLVYYFNPQLAAFFNNWYYTDKGRSLSLRPYRYDLMGKTNQAGVLKTYGATLDTLRDEYTVKAITGQIDIDSTWDSYVANWRKNGGEELLAEYAKAPLVSELLKGKEAY